VYINSEEIHNQVLKAFIQLLDFSDLEFDVALRKLLSTFRLPGEAQKIDRVMNEFAHRYCQNNPKSFSSSDTAYVLAYSLIMLNTDAHNPNVKKKMTLQDFIRNNRGI
jgi:brefeldin A-inhibited guanine nucleotide-exchange protein